MNQEMGIMDKTAESVRARVNEALKGTIERNLLRGDLPALGFSRVEHVVQDISDPGQAQSEDEALVRSVLGADDEERVRAFAARLAGLKEQEPTGV